MDATSTKQKPEYIWRNTWLIEGAASYWYGTGPAEFGPDVRQAIRFARQEDAERVLHWIVPEILRRVCRTAMHSWAEEVKPGYVEPAPES